MFSVVKQAIKKVWKPQVQRTVFFNKIPCACIHTFKWALFPDKKKEEEEEEKKNTRKQQEFSMGDQDFVALSLK